MNDLRIVNLSTYTSPEIVEHSNKDWVLFSIFASLAAFAKIIGLLLVAVWWVMLIPLILFFRKEKFRPIYLLPAAMMLLGPYLMWHSSHEIVLFGAQHESLSLLEYIASCRSRGVFRGVIKHFIGIFGWLNNPMPKPIYSILSSFMLAIVLMLLYRLIRRVKGNEQLNIIYLFLCTIFSVMSFFAMEFLNYEKTGHIIAGRYFLWLLLPMVLLVRFATLHTEPYLKKVSNVTFYLFVIAVIFINGYALVNYIGQNFT